MYNPRHFQEEDPDRCLELIRAFPFATLLIQTESGPMVNHIPMRCQVLEQGSWRLQGHIAKANELFKARAQGEALAIFSGPDGYISPNWYPSKQEDGRVVPTWNYAVVHVWGQLRLIEDRAWKLSFLDEFTREHEAGQPKPWRLSDAPSDYLEKLLAGIVGLELEVGRLEGKWKFSQNKADRDRDGILAGLSASGQNEELVRWMEAHRART